MGPKMDFVNKPKPVRPFWSDTFLALAEEKGLTTQHMAERMGMTREGIVHWLNGHRKIRLDAFLKLCQKCDLDPVTVLFGEGYIPKHLREQIAGLARTALEARPADHPAYRATARNLKKSRV